MEKREEILEKTIVGIDYGSKFAGTTVICYNYGYKVRFVASARKSDADKFLLSELTFLDPDLILIDAPLSLPGVYWLGEGYNDHFFRKCDRELGAMSPMFLGGLTARAIKLHRYLNGLGNTMHETYPRKMVEILGLPKKFYKGKKGDLRRFIDELIKTTGIKMDATQITSWHHLDALLAFFSAMRYLRSVHEEYGVKAEGVIVV
jgi:predicted nuclease with RNAse H fold